MTPPVVLAQRLHDALPQTQCTRCGYPDCQTYAEAIAHEGAAINRCPPGGAEGVARLAALTGTPVLPLDTTCGEEGPRAMAVIDEAWCIGCTLCLDACPTDAIVGIHKRMHTVIEAHCTGCELCIPVCPVDCISLENETPGRSGWQAWSKAQADAALARYTVHRQRRTAPVPDTTPTAAAPDADARKRSIVEAALARARSAKR
ncbi:MAG TPA: RnfABCDGE type electron transport complex subunit B [Variovorax sp.]